MTKIRDSICKAIEDSSGTPDPKHYIKILDRAVAEINEIHEKEIKKLKDKIEILTDIFERGLRR